MVASKLDLADKRQVRREEGEAFVRRNNFTMFFETSALQNQEKVIEKVFLTLAEKIVEKRRGVDKSGKTLKNSRIAKKEAEQEIKLEAPLPGKKEEPCKC